MKMRRIISPIVKRILMACSCFCILTFANAQSTNMGTWNIADLFYKVNNHIKIWTEVQTRSQNLYDDFYYHEMKAGVFYSPANTHSSVFVGGGRYTTYNFAGNFKSPVATEEFRMWEQLILNNVYNHFNVEHRYRIEQRWVNNVFKPRIRYRFNTTYAFNHASVVPKTLFISAFDEIFMGNNNPHLERNRYYIGMGYQFSHSFSLQLGYINQTDFNATGGLTDKRFLQTTMIFFVDKKQSRKETKIATIMD